MPANLENSAVVTGLETVSFHSNPKERDYQRTGNTYFGNTKESSSYCTIALISHTFKVMPKFSKPDFNSMWTVNFQMFKFGFREGRGTKDQISDICLIIKKAREFQKNIYFCSIDYAKAFDCVDHNKLENSPRDGNTRPPDLPSEKSVCRSRSNN